MPAGKRTKLKELGKRAVSRRGLPKTIASIIGASLLAGQLAKRRRREEERRRYMEALSKVIELGQPRVPDPDYFKKRLAESRKKLAERTYKSKTNSKKDPFGRPIGTQEKLDSREDQYEKNKLPPGYIPAEELLKKISDPNYKPKYNKPSGPAPTGGFPSFGPKPKVDFIGDAAAQGTGTTNTPVKGQPTTPQQQSNINSYFPGGVQNNIGKSTLGEDKYVPNKITYSKETEEQQRILDNMVNGGAPKSWVDEQRKKVQDMQSKDMSEKNIRVNGVPLQEIQEKMIRDYQNRLLNDKLSDLEKKDPLSEGFDDLLSSIEDLKDLIDDTGDIEDDSPSIEQVFVGTGGGSPNQGGYSNFA